MGRKVRPNSPDQAYHRFSHKMTRLGAPVRRDFSLVDAIVLDPDRIDECDCPVVEFYALDRRQETYPLPCIVCIDVDPYDRDMGIGTRIVRTWETYLTEIGCRFAGAAEVENPHFWAKLGYRPISEDPTFWAKELRKS